MPTSSETQILLRPDSSSLRFLPEGPYRLATNRISWVAIQHGGDATHGSLNLLDLATKENQSLALPERPGFAFPVEDGRHFVVGCGRQLLVVDTSDGSHSILADGIDAEVENTIINDGVAFADNIIFGCKDLEFATKKAGLYLYRGRDKQMIHLRDDQICSNGKFVRQVDDNLWLYDIDSPTRTIVRYALDLDAGTLGDAETVIDFAGDPAVPDGMLLAPATESGEESLIVAMFFPGVADHGETRQYRLDSGDLIHTWRTVGSPQNTCPQLVDSDDGIALVITTAVENYDDEQQQQCPNAGCLFIGQTEFALAQYDADSLCPALPATMIS